MTTRLLGSATGQRIARQLSATTAVGLLLGFVVGGIGSRLAMRALFLTTGPSVRGVVSDDGFSIGRFSATATLNLLIVTTLIGVIGAFVYLAVRPFLLGPRWLRVTGCAMAAGAVVGAMIVHPSGVDFTLLEPRWFAIALFVALPALFGALAPPACEWALRDDSWFQRAPAPVALLPLVVFLFPPLLVMIGVPVAVVLLVRRGMRQSPAVDAVVRHPAALWAARGLWVGAALLGVVALAKDTATLL